MKFIDYDTDRYKNFVFVGEAGSGKSEIAVNFAAYLKQQGKGKVHFFDMDMTKPLFRSRDLCSELERLDIELHFEKQYMDAPTLVGGVRRLLKSPDCNVVMDVGGDYIGARAVGGFAAELNKENCMVCYVINPYRPWSCDLEHIDQVLGAVLGSSHIRLEQVHLVSNPNIGRETGMQDITQGHQRLEDMVKPYQPIAFACAREELYETVKETLDLPVLQLHLYMEYPWNAEKSW